MQASIPLSPIRPPHVNPNILQYVINAITYLASSQSGTLNCVFIELDHSEPYNDFLGQLLQSTQLQNTTKLVLTDAFAKLNGMLHDKPSLVVISMGNRDVVSIRDSQLRDSLEVWSPSSKVLLLVETTLKNWKSIKFLNTVLYVLKYHIVTTFGMDNYRVFRYDTMAILSEERNHPIAPENLFVDNTRNMKGLEIRYNFRFRNRKAMLTKAGPVGSAVQWIIDTAKYLNASVRFVPCHSICTTILDELCYSKCMRDQKISVSLDHVTLFHLEPGTFRTMHSVIPTSDMIVVPNGRPFTIVEIFLQPFNTGTWLILLAVLGAMEVLKLIMPQHFINDPIMLSICGIEKYNLHAAGTREKIAYISLIVMFFLMTSAYEAKIIALMSERPSTQVIETLDQLVQSGLPIKTDLRFYPTKVNDSLIGRQVVNGTFDLDGINAFYSHVELVRMVLSLPSNYDLATGKKRYVPLSETLQTNVGHYRTEMRSPILPWLQWTHRVFFESGITDQFQESSVDKLHVYVRNFWHQEGYEALIDHDLIKFADFKPAWMALGVGLFGCSCVFLVELLWNKWKIKRNVTNCWE